MEIDELNKLYKKYKITSRKYMGNDSHSYAIFLNNTPKFTGLSKREIPYYKKLVLEKVQK